MNLTEKIKYINQGMRLQRYVDEVEKCQDLTDDKRGQGTQTTEIYCGSEDYAEFLIQALGKMGLGASCETYTIDGEYHVEVRL